jgi:hypothetical protein
MEVFMRQSIFGCAFLLQCLLSMHIYGEECTGAWQHDLATGPQGPKAFNGDTYAAYAVFSYENDHRTGFRLKASFPNARFFSIENYRSQKNSDFDAIVDRDIEADLGSVNPFKPGVSWRYLDQSFTIEVIPQNAPKRHPNTLRIDSTSDKGSIWLRIYSPNVGVGITSDDLPMIEAFDPFTGASKACPEGFDVPYFTAYPQALTHIVPRRKAFDFEIRDVGLAGNNAVPGYSYGVTKMPKGDVMVVKLKAPSFANSFRLDESDSLPIADVRYWSLCSQDVAGNVGLGCLADHKSLIDSEGYVTTVISQSSKARARALAMGLNFIADLRRAKQSILLMVYRNILPSESFRDHVYQGSFTPQAKVCTENEYLEGRCDW